MLVGLAAAPAAADPAGPSDFRSDVTGIVPAVPGVHAEIRGGDTFLELTVDDGHDVVVAGYTGEPYLHFLPDGTVQRNRRSAATYVNDSRTGKGVVPAEAQDPDAEPVWERIASGGSYAWHDHRVHWMQDVRPSVSRGERVPGAYDPWKVPITADGTAATVEGTLTYASSTTPIPWALLALVAAAALAVLGRGKAVLAASGALAATSVVAVVVGRADFASTPGGGNPLLWFLPVVAVLGAAVALVPQLKNAKVVGALASVAALSGWALFRIDVLTKPILPTDLPFWLDRATTALALGLSIAAAYLTVTSGQLQLAELEDD